MVRNSQPTDTCMTYVTSDLALSVGAIIALIFLLRWTKQHPAFDLSDLLTGDNGRISATKFAQTGTWLISTWGFVTLTQKGLMTEWYFMGYVGLAYGTRVLKDALSPTPKPEQ